MEYHLPYYMAYPMPFEYDDERMERRDAEYMRSLYPDMAKRLVPYIEEECDRMEYDGSMVFDEYPDKLQLRLMCDRIYERVKNRPEFSDMQNEGRRGERMRNEDMMEMQQLRRRRRDDNLRDLVEVLLFHELMNRRRNRRRRPRRFY